MSFTILQKGLHITSQQRGHKGAMTQLVIRNKNGTSLTIGQEVKEGGEA